MKVDATTLALVLGITVPFGTVYLTKLGARLHVKSLTAAVLAGLAAVAASLVGVHGHIAVNDLIRQFVDVIVAAGGSRIAVTGQFVDALARRTADKGFGAPAVPLWQYAGQPQPPAPPQAP